MKFIVCTERRHLDVFGSCKQFCGEFEVCVNAMAQNPSVSAFLSHNYVNCDDSGEDKSVWCHSSQGRHAYVALSM